MNTMVSFAPQAPSIDPDTRALGFFGKILPPEGLYCAAIKTNRKNGEFRHEFFNTIAELWEGLREANRDQREVYFALASFCPNASRKKENVQGLKCFWLDVDYGKEGHSAESYATFDEARAALRKFCVDVGLPQPIIVLSGGGLHAYWPLKEPLSRAEWERYA
jgi:hypothetical protein